MIPSVGDQFRQFRILSKAGEGGMGVVFRAEDTRLGRDVALKFLTGIGPVGADEAARLEVEGRSLAALNHTNIVTIYDIGEADGAPFLVLEWVPGRSLADGALETPCREAEFLRIATPIAEALAAAHTRKIVHRDLKPGNVLLGDSGSVKLADFGLAKFRDAQVRLTKTATVQGTASYMSPEQASGGEVGPASDVFSFGTLAYELLAGQRAFAGDNPPAMMYSIVHTAHVPLATRRPDLSPDVAELVERCLQKRPEDRFADGAELAAELHHVQRGRGVPRLDVPRRAAAHRTSDRPEIRYCTTSDGASIAYSVTGAGPVIVRVLGWFTHLEMEWEWPALRLMWELLAKKHTVVRYDGRGIGLSSSWAEGFSEEQRQLDLDAVMNAIGAKKAILYGISEGGWTAAHYASHHPERVSHLIIYGSYSRGVQFRPGYDPEELEALRTLMRKGWGRDTPQYRQIFTTAYFGEDADPGLVAHFNQIQRAAADADTATRYQDSLHARGDGTEVFARIRVPTLVIHTRDDQIVDFREGQRIASIVPGAQFLPLPTGTHYFPVDDVITHTISDAIDKFTLAGAPA